MFIIITNNSLYTFSRCIPERIRQIEAAKEMEESDSDSDNDEGFASYSSDDDADNEDENVWVANDFQFFLCLHNISQIFIKLRFYLFFSSNFFSKTGFRFGKF